MTPQEMAKAGVYLLGQAILELLSRRGRMQAKEVEDELRIPGVGYAMLTQMAADGRVEKGEGYHPPYFLPGSPDQTSTPG